MVVPLRHLFIHFSPSHFLNSLNSSYPQLITSPFHLSLSLLPLELPDLFIFPINCTFNFLFKSYAEIFFSHPVVSMILLLFES